jgi:glycerophosphoryl diester phosphodiesterase
VSPLDWLTARPIAHRGLHDPATGIVENTASAVAAAIDARYGIEVDLQISADGEAMVHHDDALGRLTEGTGPLARMTAADLRRVPFRATRDRMLTLADLCDLVGGRATLVLELKSRFDRDARIALRTAEVLRTYRGPVAAMSFDPDLIEVLAGQSPGLTRGIVAEARYDHPEWYGLSPGQKRSLAHLGHAFRTRPQFVAYAVRDLPAAAPLIARALFGLPLLTWTVRTPEQRRRAERWADQMIFEGFKP